MIGELDWAEVERRFEFICYHLTPFIFPSPPAVRQYRLGDDTALLSKGFEEYGVGTYPGSSDREQQLEAWNDAITDAAATVKPKSAQSLKAGEERLSCFQTIRLGIATRKVTNEFIFAWMQLGNLVGRQEELDFAGWDAAAEFNRKVKAGRGEASTQQRHWYALWMSQRFAEAPKADRELLHTSLALLCQKIWQLKIRAPDGFSPEWFEKLIRQQVDRTDRKVKDNVPQTGRHQTVELRKSFRSIGRKKLLRLAAEAPIDELPPSSEHDYRPAVR